MKISSILTIDSAQQLLNDNPVACRVLKALLEHSFQHKQALFKESDLTAKDELLQLGWLRDSGPNRYELIFENFAVGKVILEIAERMLGRAINADVRGALQFAEDFCLALRQPQANNHWYLNLYMYFERYVLVYVHQLLKANITAFLYKLTDDDKEDHRPLRNFEMIYRDVFPYLNDNTSEKFNAVKFLYQKKDHQHDGMDALAEISKTNFAEAEQLYEFGQANEADKLERFSTNLIIGLYDQAPAKYYQKAVTLLKKNEQDGLMTLTWLKYTDSATIQTTFELVKAHQTHTIEYYRLLPNFYCRLIENINTPEEIREQCFVGVKALTRIDDSQLKHQLLWRFTMIDGYDAEKFALLADFMAWQDRQTIVLKEYFKRFKEPKYLFDIIRDAYLQYGPKIAIDIFEEGITHHHHTDPLTFEMQLLKLLSDDLSLVRSAGVRIMNSRYHGFYEVDLHKLDQERQKRVIETLLPQPASIEQMLPLVITLRTSRFKKIKELLKAELKQLVWAYGHHMVNMTRNQLGKTNKDKTLLKAIENEYAQYEAIKKAKSELQELNPMINESEWVEYFFRLENEAKAETVDRSNSGSIFRQIAKNFNVIRGNAFKTEYNKEISKLSTVSTSILIDQRYSINPERYEWQFQMNIFGKNYNSEA